MKVSGTLDLAGLEYVADLTALNALTDPFEGRVVNMNGTICIYSGGAWIPQAAGSGSVPAVTAPTANQILRSDGTIAAWDDQYPDDTGASGKFLKSDGAGGVSWDNPAGTIPAQTGHANKLLTTDGTAASWTDAAPRASLAAGTADHVLINDGSGEMSSEAQLAPSRGGLGVDASGFNGFVKGDGAGGFTADTIDETDIPTGIDAAKIADGTVSDTEFQYLGGVTSDIQTQLDDKLSKTGGTMTGAIVLVGDPAAALQPATKQYVDNIASGLKVKNSVFVAADTNITLSGEQTIDSQSVVTGDRVLLIGQNSQAENGIWRVDSGAWTRATDADSWTELVSAFCFVEVGSYADCGFVCTVDAGGTLGTTAVTWTQFSGAGTYTEGQGLSISGNTFSVKLDGTTLEFNGSDQLKVADDVPLQTPSIVQYLDVTEVADPSAPAAGLVRFYGKDGKLWKIANGDAAGAQVAGGLVTELKTTTFTAVAGFHYLCDTTSGAFTATLPAGSDGAVIRFSDDTRNWALAALTIAPQTGETIGDLSASESLVADLGGAFVQFAWDGTRWVIDTPGYAASTTYALPSGVYDSTTGKWTFGPSTGIGTGAAAYHLFNGSLVGSLGSGSTTRWTIGHKEGLILTAGEYRDSAGTAKAIESAVGWTRLTLVKPTASTDVALQFFTDYQDMQTADAALDVTNQLTTLSCTAAGTWTFGPSSGSGLNHIFQSGASTAVRSISVSGTSNASSFQLATGASTRWSIFSGQAFTDLSGVAADSLGFYHAASGVVVGHATPSGAWTFGPSSGGGGLNHYFQSGHDCALRINAGAGFSPYLYFQENSTNKWVFYNNPADDRLYIGDADGNDGVYLAQNTTAWVSASDARMKKNVGDLTKGLDCITSIRPVEYHYNHDSDDRPKRIGFIAQELNESLPEAVSTHESSMWGVSSTEIIPVLVKAIQELKARIEALEASNG